MAKEKLIAFFRGAASYAATFAVFLSFMWVARNIFEPPQLECTCVCEEGAK